MKKITYKIDDYLFMANPSMDEIIRTMLQGKLIFRVEAERGRGMQHTLYHIHCFELKDEVCRFEL